MREIAVFKLTKTKNRDHGFLAVLPAPAIHFAKATERGKRKRVHGESYAARGGGVQLAMKSTTRSAGIGRL